MPHAAPTLVAVAVATAAIVGLAAFHHSDNLSLGHGDGVASGAVKFLAHTLLLPGGATGGILAASSSPRARNRGSGSEPVLGGGDREPEESEVVVPTLIVFDLDGTLWRPEMYTLGKCPSVPMRGSLGDDIGDGIVGLSVPPDGPTVRLFPGALRALQAIHSEPRFRNVRLAAASTSEEPTYSYACLDNLEVVPGVTMHSMFSYTVIGRTGHLTKYKSNHFRLIQEQSGVPYDEMLFFDDCNWQDHVTDMYNTYGVIGQKTPDGLTLGEFEMGLEKYRRAATAK